MSRLSQSTQRSTFSRITDVKKSGAPGFQKAAGDCQSVVEEPYELPSDDDSIYSNDSKVIDAGLTAGYARKVASNLAVPRQQELNMDGPSHAIVASELVTQRNVERVKQNERKTPTSRFARKSDSANGCFGDSPKIANNGACI
uniref:Uncharacterized protein n=1 Tax=Panagrolaimus superbus TaxID=310955 RepID=A0A914YVW6_9BILA